ncbi:MAG: right-handed parallel beta-helix repeat-containing protein [Rhodobacteraceae bacterium]|nr:right-handed parallel beta-helix repeat-containing protein [Paracoccaceae bacterium]
MPANLETTIIVSNSAELKQAMATLAAGNGGTILMKNAGEAYNAGFPNAGDNEPPITLTSFDSENPAVIERLNILNRENITIDGVVFDSSNASVERSVYTPDLEITSSSAIIVKNSVFRGSATEIFTGGDGEKQAFSMSLVRGTNGFTFENNDVSGYNHGLQFLEVKDISIKNNEIRAMQGDGMRFGGVQDVLIEGNNLHDFLGSTSNMNHNDMIQFWGTNTVMNTENVIIRGNILDAGEGSASQAIFGYNEQFSETGVYFKNFLVENNVIHNGAYQGIWLSNIDGLMIRNNTVLWNQDAKNYLNTDDPGTSHMPSIHTQNSLNVDIHGNIAPLIQVPEGVDISNNAIISYDQKSADGYIEKHFINALIGGEGDLRDLKLLPGSDWVGQFGATFNQPTATADHLTAVMATQAVFGDSHSFIFSAAFSQDETGYLNDGNAEFIWSFSDGTTLSGMTVTKTFADAGPVDVQLTVTKILAEVRAAGTPLTAISNGTATDSITRGINVMDTHLVEISFDSQVLDETSWGTLVHVDQPFDTTPVDGVTGDGFRLDGTSRISISRDNAQIHNLETFSMGMAVKLDAGSGAGNFIRLHQAMLGTVNADGSVSFSLTTGDGVFTVKSAAGLMTEAEWHKVDITYSAVNERLKLYVDGELAGMVSASGVTPSKAYWNLDLGDSWNGSIKGVIDDFSLSAGADSAQDILLDYKYMERDINVIRSSGEKLYLEGNDNNDLIAVAGQDENTAFNVKILSYAGDDDIFVTEGRARVGSGDGNDTISLGNADDIARGGKGKDIIHGGSGADFLVGNRGNDTLNGEAGDDHLRGGLHNDTLNGGTGNDVLDGGYGNDLLIGGEGEDVFFFRGAFDQGTDVVVDFTDGVDMIGISGLTYADIDITASGAGTIISLSGGGNIILEGVDHNLIDATDFLFT